MIILTIRTDNPEAEIGIYKNQNQLVYEKWQAHRRLAETIHKVIAKNLQSAGKKLDDIQGIVAFQGPGSFTGLRIGLSVANTLAASLEIPIVGASGNDWQASGIEKLLAGENESVVLPNYGSPAHTTTQKK